MLMRYVGYSDTAILTADGCVDAIGTTTDEGCCPLTPCNIDACAVMCSFIEILPNGPLWDRAKAMGMDRYTKGTSCESYCPPDGECSTLVDYAAYSGYRLASLIRGPLWDSLRESSPYTAVTTLDSWLQLYGWTGCWETLCRDRRLGPSPFECGVTEPPLGFCDSNFNPIRVPALPVDLENAVKRATAISLSRLQMAPIKNLCGINWVIEPLGAFMRPDPTAVVDTCCNGQRWEICSLSDQLEAVPPEHCVEDQSTKYVQAYIRVNALEYNPETGQCDPVPGSFINVWPGILAAQCIALSMIDAGRCEVPIRRCDDLGG